MIIPMFVDEKKDKDLIDWLNSFTNRSATMRLFLYQVKQGQGLGYNMNMGKTDKVEKQENKPLEVDENFINDMSKFG